MSSYCMFGVSAVVWVLQAQLVGAQSRELSLDKLGIKYIRDASGEIVAAKLPIQSTEEHVEAILRFQSLRDVELPDCRCAFTMIERLSELPALESLSFERTHDANNYAAAIHGIHTLKKLSFAHSDLTNSGLHDACKSHPRIQDLNISSTRVDDGAWSAILELQEIESLNISSCRLRAFGRGIAGKNEPGPFARLADLPRLKRLVAINIRLRDVDLYPFAHSCSLQHIGIGPSIQDSGAHSLIYLQRTNPALNLGRHIVKSLNGAYGHGVHSTINERGYVATLHCTSAAFELVPLDTLLELEELWIIGASDLSFVRGLPRLRKLTVEFLPQERRELAHLQHTRGLEGLIVTRANITEETLRLLFSIETLQSLTLDNCTFDTKSNEMLGMFPKSMVLRVRP